MWSSFPFHPISLTFFKSSLTRLVLCVPWEGCCIRPVWCWLLLLLWGLVTHTGGSRDDGWQMSWRSLLSPGLLCTTALSCRILQQRDQEHPSLQLPALSSRLALIHHMLYTTVFKYLSFITQKFKIPLHNFIYRGLIPSFNGCDCLTVVPLFYRLPVCHQRALFPFSYLSCWLVLSRQRQQQPAGLCTLFTWKHVPTWKWQAGVLFTRDLPGFTRTGEEEK